MSLQRYQVGGAVRDRLLGLPVREVDWVVVGATPEQMLQLGYRQVGRDFPVFLHPETQDEHALARTERKAAPGHRGFVVHAAPEVTLEMDLARRDLTVNAIAEDADGRRFDPFGGQDDLNARLLRHVSPAFVEDPLRVFRLARFAARFADLGFRVAEDTARLCQKMAQAGMLGELSAERVWQETARALMESRRPSVYFDTLRQVGALASWFPELDALFGVPQRADYHPEVDTGIHTMMCIDHAAQQDYPLPVRVCALAHDFGKALTPASELPRHPGHEHRGVPLVEAFCDRLRVPNTCREAAVVHTREHLLIHQARQLRPATLLALLERLQALRPTSGLFQTVLEAALCDARGRLGLSDCDYPQVPYLQAAAELVAEIQARDVMRPGLAGPAVGAALAAARTDALKKWRDRGIADGDRALG